MINLSQFYPTSINQNNFVYTTGDQRISGQKDFATRPTVNGSPVVLYGEFCPEDRDNGGSVIISGEGIVYTTGDQAIFDQKLFENATNLESSKFLVSGEGKFLEKLFNINLDSNNLEYYAPADPNSIVFINILESGIYSIYLPDTRYAAEGNFVKFIFEETPPIPIEFRQWYNSGNAEFLPQSGDFDITNYYASGLEVNFYSNGVDLDGNYQPSFSLTSLYPVQNNSISFLFRDGSWTIEDEKRVNEVPFHLHEVGDIIGLSGVLDGNYISLEKVYHHTFKDGLDILFKTPYERNTYANLTFETASPCYVDLPNPTGDVLNGDRIVVNIKTIVQQPERLIIRHNPFDGNGNYLLYTNLYNLPIPNVNDALEFWFQSPEWTLKSSPGGNNVGGSGSFGGGGSGCCPTIPFVGNRTIKRVNWPVNFNPQANDVTTFLNKVFYPFTPATISLNSYDLKELGTTFVNVPYVGNIVQNDEVPNGITSLQFLRNGSVIHTIQNPVFGSFNYQSSISLNTTSTLSAKVNINNDGSPTQIVATQTVDFEAPMYYGAGAPSLTENQIKNSLTKNLERVSNKTRSFTADNQKLYMVVPIGWGLFTSIKDENNFENIAGWSYRIQEFTLANGTTKQNYYIWETNNLVFNVNDYDLTFNF